MSFINVNLNDAVESRPVTAGRYDLTISEMPVEALTKEKKTPQLIVTLTIDGHPDAPEVRNYMSLPQADDEPAKFNFKVLLLRRFCDAFNIPFTKDGFELEAFVGAKAHSIELQLSEPDANGNVYNRPVFPKLRDEGGHSGASVSKPPKR